MKRIERSDYRVEILPSGGAGERDAVELANYLEEVVKRDKGLADLLFTIRVIHDSRVTCEFCGYDWETEPGSTEPACCTRAVDEWKADHQVRVLEAQTSRVAEEVEDTTRIHAGTVVEATISYAANDAILTQDLYRSVQGIHDRLT